jgi:hypothetical protein
MENIKIELKVKHLINENGVPIGYRDIYSCPLALACKEYFKYDDIVVGVFTVDDEHTGQEYIIKSSDEANPEYDFDNYITDRDLALGISNHREAVIRTITLIKK